MKSTMAISVVHSLALVLLLSPALVSTTINTGRLQDITESDLSLNYTYVVTIDPSDENAVDSKDCHPPKEGGKPDVPCKSLDYAFGQIINEHRLSSVVLYLVSPGSLYELSLPQNVTNQCDVGFYGNSSQYPLVPTVKCKQNAGLSFTNSCNLVLNSIQFLECGAMQVSTSRNLSEEHLNDMSYLTIRVGLYFYNCTNVRMYHVGVLNGSQAVGVVMYDTNGVIEVDSCDFINNSVSLDGHQAGGGGFTVEFTYCKPGDVTCNKTEYDHSHKRNNNSVYSFKGCTFERNTANKASYVNNFITPLKTDHDASGRGGGLAVFVKGDAMNNSVSVVDSRFASNYAVWGGGIRIEMSESTINNSVSIFNCNFTENRISLNTKRKYTGGGAMHIVTTTEFWKDVDENISRSKINVSNCCFEHNTAMEGGGICITMALQSGLNVKQIIEVSISNSSFEYNQARLGTAVALLDFPIFNKGFRSNINFYDCNFSNNQIMNLSDPVHPAGIGTVYVSGIPTDFINSVMFFNNGGSALVVIATQVNFAGTNATFENNSGTSGGAVALLGASWILIGPKSHMTFINNSATQYGGAIYNRYISNDDLEATCACFLRYSEPLIDPAHWDVKFIFSGNMAGHDGCSIASTSVYPCSWAEDHEVEVDKIFRWNDKWIYEKYMCKNTDIFTRASDFTFNNKSSLSDRVVEFIPGETFQLPLEAWDEFEHEVTDDTVYSVSLRDGDSVAEVDPGYTYVTSNYISLTGEPGNNITLLMETVGSRRMHVIFNMTILECPPGFIRDQDYDYSSDTSYNSPAKKRITCVCPPEHKNYRNLLKCFPRDFATKIHINYWYGRVNISKKTSSSLAFTDSVSSLYLVGMAPFAYRFVSEDMGFILNDSSIPLPKHMNQVQQFLCGSVNREGVLCGQCINGYAVAVNSPTYECVPCNLKNVTAAIFVGRLFAYIGLTYVPIVIIFIVIIFFNIKLASSAAAGFVLYAQIISSGYFDVTGYSLLYIASRNKAPLVAQSIYSNIYGILNLDSFAKFLHPFCLSEHFTTLHVLCLDYAIAAFPLVVIIVIFLCYRCKSVKCHCPPISARGDQISVDPDSSSMTSLPSVTNNLRKRKKSSPNNTLIHALTAFILLSYTKFTLASMKTVVIDELFDKTGNTVTHRIYLAGHLSFSDSEYLFPFGILAILVLIFIVFLPPLLMLGPLQLVDWLTDKPKLSWLQKVWPSITIHTFLDTFQGYKPNRRFFAGLYLLFRLFMFTTFSFSRDLQTQYAFQQVIIFVFAILVALLRPYTKDFFNYLDTMLFLNLSILNAIAIYTSEKSYSAGLYGFECFLVFLPLVYIICYAIWNRIRKKRYYKIIKNNITCHIKKQSRESCSSSQDERKRLLPFAESGDYSSTDPDEEIFNRAARGNNFRTAHVHNIPPRRPGEVPRTLISIPESQPSSANFNEENKNVSLDESDSGIGRRSSSGRFSAKSDSKTQ